MRRLRSLVVMLLLVPLMGAGISWTWAIQVLAHGAHHMSVHDEAGRLAIVLEHETASEHAHDHDVAGGTHSHPSHHDHVVVLTVSDPCATTASRQMPHDGGPTLVLTAAIASAILPAQRIQCVACSRVGLPFPSRSSILRI